MAVNTRQVTASYTHLWPYRRHLIRLDVVSMQIELLSDPNEFNVGTSGWHGRHDWAPMCRAFILQQFRFLGQNALFHYNITFRLHAWSAWHNIWRYTGYMAGAEIAEIIILHTDDVPSHPPPGQGPSPTRQLPMCTWSSHGHAASPRRSGSTTSDPSHSDSGSQVSRCQQTQSFWV